MSKLLFKSGEEWTPALLEKIWAVIEEVAVELKTTYYTPEIQVVSAKQMIDAYTSVGMPIYYKHWSFGKEFVETEKAYREGKMGLAYELVINSDPCIAYLMEENNALVQTLVMAHASVGHSAVFKNNYLFKDKTDATAIIDYIAFARTYLKKCEEKYGFDEVESVIDACHALQNYGVDKYKKPKKLSTSAEEARANARFDREVEQYDHVFQKVGENIKKNAAPTVKRVQAFKPLDEPQENILYFIEKNAPNLPAWKREVVRIVRKMAEYFSPQGPTKVLNEGYASFTHHYILNRMYDLGYLDEGSMIEMFALHSAVLLQRDGVNFNPYKLGFMIFTDIKRICEGGHWVKGKWVEITDEDRKYFPSLIGKDWAVELNYAMENFKDETFILQYLSPTVARELKLYAINDPSEFDDEYKVTQIANESGFLELRRKLAASYAAENRSPDIQITGVDTKGTRKLILEHFPKRGRPLHRENTQAVLKHLATLWEYTVQLKTFEYNEEGEKVATTLSELGKYSGTTASTTLE